MNAVGPADAARTWNRRRARHPSVFYALAAVTMLTCWTGIRYADQPHRSPAHRRGIAECLAYTARSVPAEGAGPLVVVTLLLANAGAASDAIWVLPILGTAIYVALAATLTWMGRSWSPLAHLCIGSAWLLVGSAIYTGLTMK